MPITLARVTLGLAVVLQAPQAPATPWVTPLETAIATAVGSAEDAGGGVVAFYAGRGFAPIWLGDDAEARRAALAWALERAPLHGLPRDRSAAGLRAAFAGAATPEARGRVEVEATRILLGLARQASSGVLEPARVDPTLVLDVPRPDPPAVLAAFMADPMAAARGMFPATPRYNRLLGEKLRLEAVLARGGWGPPVPAGRLAPGATGAAVVALRDRLAAMGYLPPTLSARYDDALGAAVRRFQADHGLRPDGVAGTATTAALNVPARRRLAQVIVALERQRWMNRALEPRHVLVNLAEQRAYVVDDGVATFETVVVIGHADPDRRTPEFSHVMTHMVVNPYWHVPRSIATAEYLPALKRGGARHLEVWRDGRRMDRGAIDFARYSARTFPFDLKQPPGPGNALGQVKFMFPNRWNIYLHDTPARALFDRPERAFSHGCVRVGDPEGLAHHLLAAQVDDPEGHYARIRGSGREARVDLDVPVGVHIVHWSAWVDARGRAQYRDDVYGRDAAILDALRAAGVDIGPRRG